MTNEIIPYMPSDHSSKKKSFLGGILGFLWSLKVSENLPAYQEIQSIHHVLPREEILRQMIDLFITNTERPLPSWRKDPQKKKITWAEFWEEEAAAYSEAMSGAPVCALVKTPTDAWLVAITRTVKLRWPEFVFESKPKMYERFNLDDYEAFLKKQLETREYEILRHTQGWKAIISPFKDKKLDLMSGYMFKWKEGFATGLKRAPLSKKSSEFYNRMCQLDVATLLKNMQNFHATIEMDAQKKKKYLSSEMYSRPEDYDNIVRRGHMTEYIFSGSSLVGLKGRYFWEPGLVAHGVEDNFNGLYPVREISFKAGKRRIVIPPPKNGERLIYKVEEKFYLPFNKVHELE